MTAADKEYGGALYLLAEEEGCEDEVLAGLNLAVRLLEENPDYVRLLENPAISKAEHLQLLDEALRGSLHPYALNFIKILCEKSAIRRLSGCAAVFTDRLYAARGILPVVAWSAVPLTGQQMESLKDRLSAATGKTILLNCRVDPGLMGGVKVSYEGRELDGTIAGRLDAVRQALMS